MAQEEKKLLAFNRGVVSPKGLARIDVKRIALSAETQTNYIPRVLGSMMLRPGFGYIGETVDNNTARFFPFVFSSTETALLEFTDEKMRVWTGDEVVSITNPETEFTQPGFASVTGWTFSATAGGTATASGGFLNLKGDGANASTCKQTLTISSADQNVEHTIRIQVSIGPVSLRIGTTDDGEELMSDVSLEKGDHWLRFTPTTASSFVRISAITKYTTLTDACSIRHGGDLEIPTSWSASELDDIRVAQSGDVIFACVTGQQQYRIERRSSASTAWSVVDYLVEKGPFLTENITSTTLSASATSGDITLTASTPTFKAVSGSYSGNVGSLYRISSVGQYITRVITDENQFSDPIRIVGEGEARKFKIRITNADAINAGTTIRLQYSAGSPGSWVDSDQSWTAVISGYATYDDELDNQEIYYRIGVKTGEWGSGSGDSITASLTADQGSIDGVCRITAVTNETTASAIVLKELGGTSASEVWWEGAWSDRRGWPTAVALYEARMWWVGSDNIWGSETDNYHGFDDMAVGDAGSISRRIGVGPIESIHWILPAARLLIGNALNSSNIPPALITGNNPDSIRSSSFGEPLTPTNFNIKDDSARGVFVDRSGQRVFELTTTSKQYASGLNDYSAEDLSIFTPDFNSSGITRIASQLKPDPRVHCVRNDGTVGLLIFDRAEDVICWVQVETDGKILDVVVLPGSSEDQVYYLIERTINGVTKRYLEKWAQETEAEGATINKMADSFVEYSGSTKSTIGGLLHLRGETVSAWGNGKDLGTYTVSSAGEVTLSESVTYAVIGLVYTGKFKSSKLASIESVGFNRRRSIRQLGVTMLKSHYQGLQYGPSFTQLYDLPKVEQGQVTADDTIWDTYDEDFFAFGGEWNTDSRLCLQSVAPKPCAITSLLAVVET